MKELEKLCRPLVRSLCEYWYYAKCGTAPDVKEVDHTLREQLMQIREKAEDDNHLKRDFQRIELPLVFFIDYTIKEGPFPFGRDWTEIARDYNELSGDEAFFELLTENLDDPDSSERLMMYYLFLGLGFDGCHAGDQEYIQRRMKVCATRMPEIQPSRLGAFSSPDVAEPPAFFMKKRYHFFSIYTALAVLALCLLTAIGWNFWVFYHETGDFRKALKKAEDAMKENFLSDQATKNAFRQKGQAL